MQNLPEHCFSVFQVCFTSGPVYADFLTVTVAAVLTCCNQLPAMIFKVDNASVIFGLGKSC